MAINLGNAGAAGGGGSTVHTANGISGDGSIGTPVILGGNLNQPTTITTSGNSFEVGGEDGTGTSNDLTLGAGGATLTSQNDGSTARASLILDGADGGDTKTVLQYLAPGGGGTKEISMGETNPGLVVSDNENNVGLIGDALFPESDPNQYVQFGNLPAAAITGADNGLSVSAGHVELGGSLIKTTEVVATGFDFDITQRTSTNVFTKMLFTANNIWNVVAQSALGTFASLSVSKTGGVINSSNFISVSGNQKGLTSASNVNGIAVFDDISNVGLIGNSAGSPVLFPISAPEQYAQYGNLSIPQNFALVLGSGNRTALTYAVTGGDACIQVNCSLSTSTGAGGGQTVTLAYTDINGNPASKILCLDGGATGNFPANTITIEARNGTNVTIAAAGDPGEIYRVVGAITRFF